MDTLCASSVWPTQVRSLAILTAVVTSTTLVLTIGCLADRQTNSEQLDLISGIDFFPASTRAIASKWNGEISLICREGIHDPEVIDLEIGPLTAIDVSVDGAQIATAGFDGRVMIFDATSYRMLGEFQHQAAVLDVSFSPDGKHLASAGRDSVVRIHRLPELNEIAVLRGHTRWIESLAFSCDGATLASGDWGGKLKIWDVGSAMLINEIDAHQDAILSVCFSPRSDLLLSSAQDSSPLKVWKTANGDEVVTFYITASVRDALFVSDTKVVTVNTDGALNLCDVRSRHPLCSVQGHESWATAIALTDDGKVMATGDIDGNVKFWDGFAEVESDFRFSEFKKLSNNDAKSQPTQ